METMHTDKKTETFGQSLAGLGAAWARYGLRVGAVALENQSRHLEACGKALGEALAHTAKTLTTLADNMKKADAAAPATDAAEPPQAGERALGEATPNAD